MSTKYELTVMNVTPGLYLYEYIDTRHDRVLVSVKLPELVNMYTYNLTDIPKMYTVVCINGGKSVIIPTLL